MKDGELQRRTRAFALQAIRFVESLPSHRTAEVLGRQLLRSATSVGANYRSACRAKSKADFIAKLAIVEEEADECVYWLDLMVEAKVVSASLAVGLREEADEITAMVVASIQQARRTKEVEHSAFRTPHSALVKGQALIELAVMGSLLIMLMGALLSYGLNYDFNQQAMMESFREALGLTQGANTSASYLVVKDRHIPSPSHPFEAGTIVPVSSSASVTRNYSMEQTPNDPPGTTIKINDQLMTLTTADFQTVTGVPESSLDRYKEIYGPTNVCTKASCGGGPAGCVTQEPNPQGGLVCVESLFTVKILDSCLGGIISYEGCVQQARQIVDSGFCTDMCNKGKPADSTKDCASICSEPMQTPAYAVDCHKAGDCPVLDALFAGIRTMGLQPGYVKANDMNYTLQTQEASGTTTSTTSGNWNEQTTRTIVTTNGRQEVTRREVTTEKDIPVDERWTVSR